MDGRKSGNPAARRPAKPSPRLDLNPAAFWVIARHKGWTSQEQASAGLRIGRATLSRALAGIGVLDNRTMAAMLTAAKSADVTLGAALEQLFVLVEDEEEAKAAA